jgi:protein FrlC
MNRDQLYAMNIHYRYYDLEYFFRACQKMNLKHAELWLCPQHFYINSMWSESPEKLKGLMKRSGVQISCICPEQNNPKPNNIAARSELLIENTRKYFQNVIILASELGCDKILVTPGWNYHDEEVDEARKRSIRMLQSLCDIADPYGISLAMESIWDHSSDIANTKEKVKLIKDGVDREN